jgi:hypothetical protein
VLPANKSMYSSTLTIESAGRKNVLPGTPAASLPISEGMDDFVISGRRSIVSKTSSLSSKAHSETFHPARFEARRTNAEDCNLKHAEQRLYLTRPVPDADLALTMVRIIEELALEERLAAMVDRAMRRLAQMKFMK